MDVGLRDARKTFGRSISNSKGRRTEMAETYYPYLQTKPMEMLYNIFPQTLSKLNRRVFEK